MGTQTNGQAAMSFICSTSIQRKNMNVCTVEETVMEFILWAYLVKNFLQFQQRQNNFQKSSKIILMKRLHLEEEI